MFCLRPLHWCLLRLPPELSHHLVLGALRLWQWLWFRLLRHRPVQAPAVHCIAGFGLRFPGRVGLAAGFDKNAEVFAGLSLLGFGFIEVGTVTPLPQPGNAKPRIFRHRPQSLVNHMGFPGCGLEEFVRNLARYRSVVNVPLLANLGKNKATSSEAAFDDYHRAMAALQGKVDGFVINLSSPNTPGLFQLQSEGFIERVVAGCPRGVPTWIKLSPDLEDHELRHLAEFVAGEPRLAGLVLSNTSRKLAEALVGAKEGGLSGAALHPRALECVAIARASMPNKTLIGVGGIGDDEGARRMREAGADLIEVYTGFIYQGPRLVREINRAFGKF